MTSQLPMQVFNRIEIGRPLGRLPVSVAGFLVGVVLLCCLLVQRALADSFDPYTMDPPQDPEFPPTVSELFFDSQGSMLTGMMYLAGGVGPHPTVVLLHGYPGNEKNLDIAQLLRRSGFNILFFHYRGSWGSQGQFSMLNYGEDIEAALKFLRSNHAQYRVDTKHLSLLGHSAGGYAALVGGAADADLECVAGMAAANFAVESDAQWQDFARYTDNLIMLAGYSGKQALRELREHKSLFDTRLVSAGLRGKSVLLIAGKEDKVVPMATMHFPVVEVYAKDPEIRLSHYEISGDHSFSWSRLQLTRLVQGWMMQNCR